MPEFSGSNSGSCDDTNLSSVDNNAATNTSLPSQSSTHFNKVSLCEITSLSNPALSSSLPASPRP